MEGGEAVVRMYCVTFTKGEKLEQDMVVRDGNPSAWEAKTGRPRYAWVHSKALFQ